MHPAFVHEIIRQFVPSGLAAAETSTLPAGTPFAYRDMPRCFRAGGSVRAWDARPRGRGFQVWQFSPLYSYPRQQTAGRRESRGLRALDKVVNSVSYETLSLLLLLMLPLRRARFARELRWSCSGSGVGLGLGRTRLSVIALFATAIYSFGQSRRDVSDLKGRKRCNYCQ
jgi:hypothetical protein